MSSTNTFAHSGAKGLGENLAMYGSTALPDCATLAKKFVQMWYDEVAKYDFAKATFTPGNFNLKNTHQKLQIFIWFVHSKETGHFTQVVWKSSTKLGCGIAIANNKAVGVCNYSPAGNYLGQFATNVLKA